jgi:hypothetical protein
MADFENNKFSLQTLIMVCGGVITMIGYLNNRFNRVDEKFEMFEKKYLMAISEQALINQALDFRIKMFEKRTSNKENKNYYYDPKQAVLPTNIELKQDDNV